MVRVVQAGRLRLWNIGAWLLLAVGVVWSVRHVPAISGRPSVMAVASVFPLLLAGVKLLVMAAHAVVRIIRNKRDEHKTVDAELSVRIGKLEIQWKYKVRK